jgi:hypothetical protein
VARCAKSRCSDARRIYHRSSCLVAARSGRRRSRCSGVQSRPIRCQRSAHGQGKGGGAGEGPEKGRGLPRISDTLWLRWRRGGY